MRERVAIFVDGENLGCAHAERLIGIAEARGEVVLARVYGDVTRLNGWREAHRFTNVHAGTGKNAADILMSLDALELALDGRFAACVLASSDRDFSHLAVKLRVRGLTVIGAGEGKTSGAFRAKCSWFAEIGSQKNNMPAAASKEPAKGELDRRIEELIRANGDPAGMSIKLLGSRMHSTYAIRCSDLEEENWRGYLAKQKSFYDLDGPGEGARVRLKSPVAHA